MRREFLLNILFLIAVNLVIKPLYIFGIDLKVQNTVGPGAYGLFAALFSLTYILQIVNDAGIQQFNNQSIARDRGLLPEQFPRLSGLKGWLAGIYLLTCMAVALLMGYDASVWLFMLHIAVNQILLSWLLFLRSNVSGLGWYRRDSLLSVSDKVWMLVLAGVLLYHPFFRERFTIQWFVWAQTLSLLLTIVPARLVLRGQGLRWRRPESLRRLWPLMRRSMPFALAVLLMTSYNRMDTVLLERLLPEGEVQAGVYYMAFRLLDALNNFAFLFAALLLPMFSSLLARGEDPGPLVTLGTRLLITGSVATAVAMHRFAPEWIHGLYRDAPEEAVTALRWLIWVFVPVCLINVYATLLTAGSRLGLMNRALGLAVVLNLVLLLVLIPALGIRGAAMTALLTQSGVALTLMLLCYREMPLRWPRGEGWRLLVFGAGAGTLLFLPLPVHTNWLFNFALVLAGPVLLASLLGLLPVRHFLQMLRSRMASR
jgi:O-antigen/teichoic acid export membrane protein